MSTEILPATGVMNAITLTITGTEDFDDTIIALRSAGTITETNAGYLRSHTDGYKVSL